MKNKSRFLFLLIFAFILVLFFISWQGIGKGHLLSYRNIDKGLDLSGGVFIVYEALDDEKNTSLKAQNDETITTENISQTTQTTTEVSSQTSTKQQSENTEQQEEQQDVKASWQDKMNSAISMIQKRLDRKGWTEANVYQEGKKRIRVEIPGVEDIQTAINEIGQTAKLVFMDSEGNVVLEGKDVINATKAAVTTQTGLQEIVVNLKFNEKGKQAFAKATQENIGKPLFIILDNSIISMPTVNSAITDGSAMITGSFDIDSAEELASLIRAGSLPFELKILETNTVGATLGANALKSSIFGGAVGLILVLIFMLLFYKMNGFAANLALIIYLLSELILLNFFNIVLTLHGIAGIILSIGMAVDANVIIFERIREELAQGRTIKLAINKGFSRALSAILDSNITTLIAAAVLYWLGTGAIKGFAQTLILGIVLSMFTSLVVTRIILNIMVNSGIKNPKLYCGK